MEWEREMTGQREKEAWQHGTEADAADQKDRGYHEAVQWTLRYIDRHISEKMNMAYVANKKNLNYSYFSQLFKRETGHTFSEYVNMRRMQIAGDRILEGASMEEVSQAVGFESVKSFFRAFKGYYRMAPSVWKRQNLEKRR